MSDSLWLGLASALTGAIARILAKVVLRYSDTRNYLSVNFAALFVLMIPLAPFMFQLTPTPLTFAVLLAASGLDFAANYFYFKSFEVEEASTVSALLALSPLFTLLAAPLVDRAAWLELRPAQIGGIVVAVLGVVLLNREMQRHTAAAAPRRPLTRLAYPLIAACLLGVNVYLIKGLFSAHLMNPFTYYFLRLLIVALLSVVVFRPDLRWVNRASLSVVLGRGVFVIGQWLTMLTALELGNPSLVKAVSESSPLFVVFLAALFLHERITWRKAVGVLLVAAGLWALAG